MEGIDQNSIAVEAQFHAEDHDLNYSNSVSTAEVQVNISREKTLDKVCEGVLQPAKKIVEDFGCDPINSYSLNFK